MKVLAFNASPRKTEGASDALMNLFLEGAKEAGANVERHYVVDLYVKGCTGCFSCWWKTPGRCIHRDDMDWVIPRMLESDVTYFGTPIYGHNISHCLQRLRERMFPLSLPEMFIEDGETRHPGRTKKFPHTVLAAVCGFPDLSNFKVAEMLFPAATHIFLPAAQILFDAEGIRLVSDFVDAVKEAGRELGRGKALSDELKRRLVVHYPDEAKRIIVERHNEYSRRA